MLQYTVKANEVPLSWLFISINCVCHVSLGHKTVKLWQLTGVDACNGTSLFFNLSINQVCFKRSWSNLFILLQKNFSIKNLQGIKKK